MKKTILCLLLLLRAIPCEGANSQTDKMPVVRLKKLIPETWIDIPAIDPAIPKDYVLGILQTGDYIFWGKAEDIKAYVKNQAATINSPLYTIKQPYEITQTGPNAFSGEAEFKANLVKQGVKRLNIQKFNWGEYPVIVFEGIQKDGKLSRTAIVGTNNKSGLVLQIAFISGKNEKQSADAWNHFLHNTRPLKGKELFLLKGMDLHDGYTIYQEGSAKIKALAERRNGDKKTAVKVETLTPKTSFQILDIQEGTMNSEWMNGAPSVTLFGRLTENSKNFGTVIVDTVITVLIKKVEEYSFKDTISEKN